MPTKEPLTASRLARRRLCPRADYLRYELRLRREVAAQPLRMGAAFAKGKELWRRGHSTVAAAATALAPYQNEAPSCVDSYEWAVEHWTVRSLLEAYFIRYQNDDLRWLWAEARFEMPLVNPETGGKSRSFVLAGKIDGIAQLPDGRVVVYEDKTTSANIEGGDYWLRLGYDAQISQYILGARELGYDVAAVLYDVTRKPAIRPRQIPMLDSDGLKIVLDDRRERVLLAGGKPRQSANLAKGYILQTEPELPAMFGERLQADVSERPAWYFQRREIPRLEDDLLAFKMELWQQSQLLLESRRRNWWFRNVSPMTCNYCEFKNLCLNGVTVDPAHPPAGFARVDDPNPELQENKQDATTTAATKEEKATSVE